MKILFIGDIFGEQGRIAVKENLAFVVKENSIDFVIANGENTTHGSGLIYKHYEELISYGINAITSGNHFFSRNYNLSYFNKTPLLIRPYNINKSVSGCGSRVFNVNGINIRVTNLIGNAMIRDYGQDNIYKAMDELLKTCNEKIHIVDLHAEASGEKVAFSYNYDGKVSAIVGTHTHITTADENILPKKTAYITDVGMTGPYRSCIGSKINPTIKKLKDYSSTKPDVSNNKAAFNAVIIDIDNETGLARSIKRINIIPESDGEIDYEN